MFTEEENTLHIVIEADLDTFNKQNYPSSLQVCAIICQYSLFTVSCLSGMVQTFMVSTCLGRKL